MLLIHECKKTLYSFAFVFLLIITIAITFGQDIISFKNDKIEVPKPGQEYGIKTTEGPEVIMPAAIQSLQRECEANSYGAYPVGFYKNVKLKEEQQKEMELILSELNQKPSISYEKFIDCMGRADTLIGGGSSYAEQNLIKFGQIPITYEEALKQYELWEKEDQFTGAYARLFSDYMGVGVLSIVPVFLGVVMCMKDKRAKMAELIHTRSVSSARIILVRYLAILIAVMIPTLLLAYVSNASVWNLFPGKTLDYLAPLKYCVGWLLPCVMISSAVGICFTELTGTPIAVVIQGLWWFIDTNKGLSEIKGGYSLFRLVPRHNTMGNTQLFIDRFDNLLANRLLFTALSLLLVGLTIIIYEKKRRGSRYGITVMANRKHKPAS